jgi:hypothetical protein
MANTQPDSLLTGLLVGLPILVRFLDIFLTFS